MQDSFFIFDRPQFASLEVKLIFDHELVETVYSLPENLRISNKTYKPILQNYSKKYHQKFKTRTILKKGFSLPLSLFDPIN